MPALIGANLEHFRSGYTIKPRPIEAIIAVMQLTDHTGHKGNHIVLASTKACDGFAQVFIIYPCHIRGLYMRSMAMAVPSPPPMQIAATPRLRSCRSKAFSKVTKIRAPEAPIG